MADRDFTIGDLLFNIQVTLNHPAFTKGKKTVAASEVTETWRIAIILKDSCKMCNTKTKSISNSKWIIPVESLKYLDKVLILYVALVNLKATPYWGQHCYVLRRKLNISYPVDGVECS